MNQYSERAPRGRGFRLVLWALVSLLLSAACVALGIWQLQRADYKARLQQDTAQVALSAAVDLAQLANAGADPVERADATHRAPASDRTANRYALPIKVSGRVQLHSDAVLLLDNQIVDGHAGVAVLVLATVRGSARPLLINLGWIGWGPSREMPALRALPTGYVDVRGVVAAATRTGLRLGLAEARRSPTPSLVNYLDIDALRHSLDPQLLRGVLLLDSDLDYGYARQWQVIDPRMPPERHQAYALQWFALALTVVITFFILARRKRS